MTDKSALLDQLKLDHSARDSAPSHRGRWLLGADDDGDDDERAVARNWVEPPFDIGRYPSPLAGFRKYIDPLGQENAANVYDRTLFTIEGAPAGTRVRGSSSRGTGLICSSPLQ